MTSEILDEASYSTLNIVSWEC